MTIPLIAASLLAADFTRLGAEVYALEHAGADWLHLDIMDGLYVPSLTFGPPVIAALRSKTTLCFDAHLMVTEPDKLLKDLQKSGVNRVTVHPDVCPHLHRTLGMIRDLGMQAGVALNPGTSVECLRYVLPLVDQILVMTVNPGFGGQAFIPEMLMKILDVQTMIASLPIILQVDGGITDTTSQNVIKAGAQCLVAGTAILKSANYKLAVDMLKRVPA